MFYFRVEFSRIVHRIHLHPVPGLVYPQLPSPHVPAVLPINDRVVFARQLCLLPCVQCVTHSPSQQGEAGGVLGEVLLGILDNVHHYPFVLLPGLPCLTKDVFVPHADGPAGIPHEPAAHKS